MRADNEPAESAARVNTLRATREEVLGELAAQAWRRAPAPDLPEGIVLDDPYDLHGPTRSSAARSCRSRAASMLVARAVDRNPASACSTCARPRARRRLTWPR